MPLPLLPLHRVPHLLQTPVFAFAFALSGAAILPGAPTAHAAVAPPSPELQAEMVAQLHAYGRDYVSVPIPELGDRKYLKVTGVTLGGANAEFLYVQLAVRLRVMQYGLVLYTVDGTAHGQFRLGNVTAELGCIAAAPFESSPLTVTSLSIPRITTPEQHEAVKNVLRGFYPANLCVPIRPSLSISGAAAEECIALDHKPGLLPGVARFSVALSNLSARDVSITWNTANGSARAGYDYTAASATMTIARLSSTSTINVTIRCDQLFEGDETFYVNLLSVANAIVADGRGEGLIIDYPL